MAFKIIYNSRRWKFFEALCIELNPTLAEDAEISWRSKQKQRTWGPLRKAILSPDLDSVIVGVADMTGEDFVVARSAALALCQEVARIDAMHAHPSLLDCAASADLFLAYWQLLGLAIAVMTDPYMAALHPKGPEWLASEMSSLRQLESCFSVPLKEAARIAKTEIDRKRFLGFDYDSVSDALIWQFSNLCYSRPLQAEGTSRSALSIQMSHYSAANRIWAMLMTGVGRGPLANNAWKTKVILQSIEFISAYPPTASADTAPSMGRKPA
jgi:hypothetical protein